MTYTLPKNIFRRGNVYSVRFDVPLEAQTVVGRKQIVRSLGTSDLGEALVRRDAVLKEIQISLYAEHDTTATPKPNSKTDRGTTVRQTAHRWLSESDGITFGTRNKYRAFLTAFEVFAGNPEVTKIDRQLALDFIEHLKSTPSAKTGKPMAQRTIHSYQVCLSSYWRVLDHWGLVDPNMRNPFSSLLRRIAGQKKQVDLRKKNLRPVTRNEAEALLAYIANNDRLKYQNEMFTIVRLLWVTACRLGEICNLRIDEIDDNGDHIVLHINNAKTDAGNRIVMVVGSADCDLLRGAVRLAESVEPVSADNVGHLFPRLLRGGYNRSLAHYVGKSLEKARKTFPDTSAEWDMHSFRRTGVSALVNAGVPRGERNLAVGHSNKYDIGMDVYARRGDLTEVIKGTFSVLLDELGGYLKSYQPSSSKENYGD